MLQKLCLRGLIALVATSVSVFAFAGELKNARVWAGPEKTRVVFELDEKPTYKLFTLGNPHRVVVDIKDAKNTVAMQRIHPPGGPLKKIRAGIKQSTDLRLVMDLRHAAKPSHFILAPAGERGYRLVVDLPGKFAAAKANPSVQSATPLKPKPAKVAKAKVKPATKKPVVAAKTKPKPTKKTVTKPVPPVAKRHKAPKHKRPQPGALKGRDLVVAIDAGHGGHDSGAVGASGTLEKDVVLSMAKILQKLVQKEPGMRAVMIRDKDNFVKLRKRLAIARNQRADIFVSIHANAFTDARVRGAAIYTLSNGGATSEMALWVAKHANASPDLGGVSLEDKGGDLAKVLIGLSQDATMEASLDVGSHMLGQLKRVGKLYRNDVQQADFAVLKSPDIPSVLIETAFISNPSEEKRLKRPAYQKQIAKAVLNGMKSYFAKHPVPGTLLAEQHRKNRKHVVKKGDTLGEIAVRYGVNTSQLKAFNGLRGNAVRVGETIRIPSY